MLYKPSYCCECGEKIERTVWKVLTSRRFCELCETEYSFQERSVKIVASAGTMAAILFAVNAFRPDSVKTNQIAGIRSPVKIEETDSRETPAKLLESTKSAVGNRANDSNSQESSAIKVESNIDRVVTGNQHGIDKKQQNGGAMPVYFCGAQTKKGSPCSRKVKGGGRCWQHVGQEAILPVKQLLISH